MTEEKVGRSPCRRSRGAAGGREGAARRAFEDAEARQRGLRERERLERAQEREELEKERALRLVQGIGQGIGLALAQPGGCRRRGTILVIASPWAPNWRRGPCVTVVFAAAARDEHDA